MEFFPLQYKANQNAWMISKFFAEWLMKINKDMWRKKKKIHFINSCKAHKITPDIKALKIVFLPPNTTSKLQLLDQGIIRNFKAGYRKEVVRKNIDAIDRQEISLLNVLDCMKMTDRVWRQVTQKSQTVSAKLVLLKMKKMKLNRMRKRKAVLNQKMKCNLKNGV